MGTAGTELRWQVELSAEDIQQTAAAAFESCWHLLEETAKVLKLMVRLGIRLH